MNTTHNYLLKSVIYKNKKTKLQCTVPACLLTTGTGRRNWNGKGKYAVKVGINVQYS